MLKIYQRETEYKAIARTKNFKMSLRIEKPKTQRGKRAIDYKEPKVHENDKTCMIMKGGNTTQTVTDVLKELHMLKKPHAIMFKKKNVTRPFEDETSLEFFSNRSDASLFAFGSNSKKRPNNLVLGRMYDGHILDMAEFGIDKFVSMLKINGPKCAVGTKPALVFNGDGFSQDSDMRRIKNMLIDFFRGPVIENIRLVGVEHVISFTHVDDKILVRNYRIYQKKEGIISVPQVELRNMGPSLDLSVRRTRFASDDLFKHALKQPKTAKPKKRKNISHDDFGSKLGRIHMTKQDLSKLPDRKMRRVKKIEKKDGEKSDEPPAKKARKSSEEEED